MKLTTAIDIGRDCGLDSPEEAVNNVIIHAMNLFMNIVNYVFSLRLLKNYVVFVILAKPAICVVNWRMYNETRIWQKNQYLQ
jgi:hypothetical protein